METGIIIRILCEVHKLGIDKLLGMLSISILQIDHLIGCVHHDDADAMVIPF